MEIIFEKDYLVHDKKLNSLKFLDSCPGSPQAKEIKENQAPALGGMG